MRRLLLKLLVIACPLFVAMLFIELGLSTIETSYSFKKNLLRQQGANVRVLVLGSSHAYYGIDPGYFAWPGLNLANVSQSLRYDAALLEKYAPVCPNLRVVILAISDFSLGYSLADSGEYWREFFYFRTYGIPVEKASMLFDARNYFLFALYGRNDSLSYLSRGFKVNLAANITSSGSYAAAPPDLSKVSQAINDETAKDEVAIHNSVYFERNVASNRRFLENAIQFSKGQGILPVLVTTPVFHAYEQFINPLVWQEVESEVHSISTRYGVEYYNFMNDRRFESTDFVDPDHLNLRGAEKLSRIINDEILAHHL